MPPQRPAGWVLASPPAVLLPALLCACRIAPVTLPPVPPYEVNRQDRSHKEPPRLVPIEAYLRTYLRIFGGGKPGGRGMTALEAQRRLGGNGLFDNWVTYLGALGLPSYPLDLPRRGETNALMIAAFERLGIALCDRAVENDLKARPPVPIADRAVFTFDVPKEPLAEPDFAPRFDQLHRLFLGYPARLAPSVRTARFYHLYRDIVARHDPRATRFTPVEAGWAAVCYGLVRHPEFHLY